MCGIAGILGLGGRSIREDDLTRMTASLEHRGPDGRAVKVLGAVGLGHTRLAILDLSDQAAQPMPYADGRFWIVHNGEVYNFIEIRGELEALGHRFRTQSDTEVVVAAYAEWGERCLERLNGMWAFAIWDADRRSLFLSRDRFGVKPLYFFERDGQFAFASEMKAFLGLSVCPGRIDAGAVAMALDDPSAYEASSQSLLQGVTRLEPGSWMRVEEDGGRQVRSWWDLCESLTVVPGTHAERVEQFREIFFDACKLRMRSDVPIATSLSGGLDSSSVVCALSSIAGGTSRAERFPPRWQRAFVASYPGTAHEESAYAKKVLEVLGIPGTFIEIDPVRDLAALDDFVFQTEQTANPHLGAWLLYRRMRQDGVRVSLDGHGGDEVLCGYAHQVASALDEMLGWPCRVREAVELHTVQRALVHGDPHGATARDVASVLAACGRRVLRDRMRARGPVRRRQMEATGGDGKILSARTFLTMKRPGRSPAIEKDIERMRRLRGPLHAVLYRDLRSQTLPGILRSYDLYSMASGIEVRSPFLDWRVVTYCYSVPAASLAGAGFTKRMLRSALRGVLPEEVRTRVRKVPFKSPLTDWSRGELRDFVLDSVHSAAFVQSSFWDGRSLARAVEARAGRWEARELSIIWRFILMAKFVELFRSASSHVASRRFEAPGAEAEQSRRI